MLKKITTFIIITFSLFFAIDTQASELIFESNEITENRIKIGNNEKTEILNVNEWHEKGFTGKGVKILLSDNGKVWEDFPLFDGKVKVLNDDNYSDVPTNDHAMTSAQVLHMIAPDAEIYVTQFPSMWEAINFDYQIVSSSNSSSVQYMQEISDMNNNQFKRAYEKGIFMNNAIGNRGNDSYNGWAESPYWWSTGALVKFRDNIELLSYSSTSENLKSTTLTEFDVYHFGKGDTLPMPYGGTSGASPVLNGMVALYYQYYKEINGVFPDVENVRNFIIENSEDLGSIGKDEKYGYGFFKLPELNIVEEIIKEEPIKSCEIVPDSENPQAVEMINQQGEIRFVHIKLVQEYLNERGYKLVSCVK